MGCNCCSTPADGVRTDYQYAVKVVCGPIPKGDASPLPPGNYFTKVNIHNFSRCDCTTFRWKVAVGEPGLRVGPISAFQSATLCADEAMEIATRDIQDRLARPKGRRQPDQHVEGWVVIESPTELDVVAVYASGAVADGSIETFHTERVCPRVLAVCDDFEADISTGVAAWEVKMPGSSSFEAATLTSHKSPWAQPLAGSIWISGGSPAKGEHVFRLPFKLCSGFTNPELHLSVLADYFANVFLNGQQVPPTQTTGPGYSQPVNFSMTSGFKAGENELLVVVMGRGRTLAALDLIGSIVAEGGLCPGGTGVAVLPCPTIKYGLYTRWFEKAAGFFMDCCKQWDSADGPNETDPKVPERRAEMLRMSIDKGPPGTGIRYKVFTRNLVGPLKGWSDWHYDGDPAGIVGADRGITAICVELVNAPVNCHIRYRVWTRKRMTTRVGGISQSPDAYDGGIAGTTGPVGWLPQFPPIVTFSAEVI